MSGKITSQKHASVKHNNGEKSEPTDVACFEHGQNYSPSFFSEFFLLFHFYSVLTCVTSDQRELVIVNFFKISADDNKKGLVKLL